MGLRKEEINRKLLHLFALLMPVGIFYFPKWSIPESVPLGILAFLFAGSVVVENLRFRIPSIQKLFLRSVGSMLRDEETNKTTGSTYIIGAALLCSILFYNHPHISFIVLTLFILGDAIAAIVGLSIGKIKIGKKSLEGSAACFLLCMILCHAVFPFLPGLLESWGGKMPFIISVISSLAITVFELIPLKIHRKIVINDNLAVPVIAGYIMLGLSVLISV